MKRVKMKKLLLPLLVLVLGAQSVSAEEKSMEELSKEIANPLAQIWNLSFQYNHTSMSSKDVDLIAGNNYIDTTLFQPVLPIPINDTWTAFARPVITYVKGPTKAVIGPFGTGRHPIAYGTDSNARLGDLILPMGVGVAKKEGWSWGAGATFIFPTSQHEVLASHQFQAGPTALLLWANKDWMIGGHLQHWWGVSGDDEFDQSGYPTANHSDLQYFIIYHLPDAWQLRASPHITVNWNESKDNKLTLPVALGIGKMVKVGPMPVMLMAEYQKSLITPDNLGKDETLMFQANFIIKNPFGDL